MEQDFFMGVPFFIVHHYKKRRAFRTRFSVAFHFTKKLKQMLQSLTQKGFLVTIVFTFSGANAYSLIERPTFLYSKILVFPVVIENAVH